MESEGEGKGGSFNKSKLVSMTKEDCGSGIMTSAIPAHNLVTEEVE